MSNKFAAAMKTAKPPAPADPTPAATAVGPAQPPAKKPSSRQGSRHVGGYFDPAVVRQLKQITVDEDSTLQQLLAESIDLLFQSRRMPTIAQKPDAGK
jgi:hypothetical protein